MIRRFAVALTLAAACALISAPSHAASRCANPVQSVPGAGGLPAGQTICVFNNYTRKHCHGGKMLVTGGNLSQGIPRKTQCVRG